jgi:hypothetical protein
MSLLILTPAMGQKDTSATERKVMVSEEGIEYEVAGWDSRIIYNPVSYSYLHWQTPVYKATKTKEVYPVLVSQFDQAPVFSEDCVDTDNPIDCTNEKLQEFIAAQDFNYPIRAKVNFQEGLEYVTFVLNEKGKFEGKPSVLSKDEPCKGCSDNAVEIVMLTEGKWQPAILNGEPVKVILTIPVRFSLEEFLPK